MLFIEVIQVLKLLFAMIVSRLVLILVVFICCCYGQFTIRMRSNPSGCFGGQPCIFQPSVAVYTFDNQIAVSYVGTISAIMGASPSGFELLYKRECGLSGCGPAVSGTMASAKIVFGVATFNNLTLTTAGSGYTLEFIGRDASGAAFSSVYSDPFAVTIGPLFKIQFSSFIGHTLGGQPFNPQPVIATADRGGNIVTSVNNYQVTASLTGPTTALLPKAALVTTFFHGLAQFTGLYVNQAGSGYQLTFTTNVDIVHIAPLISTPITVGVGEPYSLEFFPGTTIGSNSRILGGEFLGITPQLRILDRGGNLVSEDSTSGIRVAISNNPADGQLLPIANTFQVALFGVIRFPSLRITAAGQGYILSFTLFQYNQAKNTFTAYTSPSVVIHSELFTVDVGLPRSLFIATPASRAYSGGQAFSVQPIVQIRDYGGNVVSYDYSSDITASMISSLSAGSSIRLQADTNVTNEIVSITTPTLGGSYGVGEVIYFHVLFQYEVWLHFLHPSSRPYLTLTASNSHGLPVVASLVGAFSRQEFLTFKYVVADGDSGSGLTFINLYSNGTSFKDGNGHGFLLTPPTTPITSIKSIDIDTTVTNAVAVNTTTASGEYGAGEVISFYIRFDSPVAVGGYPILVLNSAATISTGYYYNSNYYGYAKYNRMHDQHTPVFDYLVQSGDSTSLLQFQTIIQTPSNSYIRRASTVPTKAVNYSVASLVPSFTASYTIVIDTAAPILNSTYGVQTSHADGTFYPGEVFYIRLQFTKPVAVSGVDIVLTMECGIRSVLSVPCDAPIDSVFSDQKTLQFKFKMPNLVNASQLEILSGGHALRVPNAPYYIRRYSTNPTTNADVNTTLVFVGGHSLTSRSHIVLYGFVPLVKYTSLVYFNSSVNSNKLYPDDTVTFLVRFSTRVVTSCNPIVVMAVGFAREAVFISGNMTNTFKFQYTVQTGDYSSGLNYRFTPNALCYQTGCPKITSCTIKAYSSNPQFSADISMPLTNGNRATGIPIYTNLTIFPKPRSRNTTIVSISTLTPNGNYGAGTIIQFEVVFSDDVLYTTNTGLIAPRLYLTLGKYANYSGGSGTKLFTFFYVIQPGDSTSDFDLKVNPATGNVFSCNVYDSCFARNRIGQYLDPTSGASKVTFSNIVIDTSKPKVLTIWSDKPTSPYYRRYTIGETIPIYVLFDKPVAVVGKAPRIQMNTSNHINGLQYAIYSSSLSNSTFLVFNYFVVDGDHSPDLVYLNNQIDMNGGQTIVYRKGDLPITVVDPTLPPITSLSRTGQILHLETNNPPHILRVFAQPTTGTFRVGDSFHVTIEFSQYVVCTGAPELSLNLGDHIGFAEFVNPTLTAVNFTGYPTEPMTTLLFHYTVAANDFSYDLDYADRYSLSPGKTPAGAAGIIYAAATTIIQRAVLDLPVPSTFGSLSYSSQVFVDGRQTYQTSLSLENPSGTYGVGANIFIRMNFSTDVVVFGSPEIVMETGVDFDRPAVYHSGNGTNSLLFLLIPHPGDFNPKLDYRIDRAKLSSAIDSFIINGKIVTASSNPSLPVFIQLNPITGVLSGEKSLTAAVGTVPYLDLGISIFGPDYILRFTSAPALAHSTITAQQKLFVSFSNQYDVIPKEGQKGDLVGWSVAASGNMVAVGAPNSNLSVTSIQTITTTGVNLPPTPEVQVIRTVIIPRPLIQSFHTTADVNEIVGGEFRMMYGGYGPTRWISANLNGPMIEVFLSKDFTSLGNISVSREPYIYCACENAFTWTITFLDINTGDGIPLTFDYSRLTGSGAAIAGPTIVQAPAKLSGFFKLKAFGLETRNIPVAASPSQLQDALSDLDLSVLGISISPVDLTLQRSWMVTFDAHNNFYEIPLLEVDYSLLKGGDCQVVVLETRKGIHGPAGLEGSFKLSWRGNTTVSLSPNVSATEMKAALEALPVINTVNVNRSVASPINGYTWTIEFVEVRTNSPRGYSVDKTANCEAFVPVNNLIGTNVSILVGTIQFKNRHSFSDAFRQGTYGTAAGAVYMFQNTIDQYTQVATVRGNDTNENDQFGFSVAMDTDVLLVGAVSADKNGVLEKQAVFCSATSGYFVLEFRGWTSNRIYATDTITEFYNAIIADPQLFAKLHNLINIYVDDWGGGALCDNHTAVITFFSPVDGAPNLFPTDTGSNLELMTVYENGLDINGTGTVRVEPVQDGTIRVHGTQADPQQIGSAYIFTAKYQCPINVTICYKRNWEQIAQFFPTVNLNTPTKFGYSVSINSTIAVIGAPGDGSGSVYVYTNITGSWVMLQRITVAGLKTGDALGHSVSVHQNTIYIGAPFYNHSQGSVYVYKRPASGGVFSSAQVLLPPPLLFTIGSGDLYGISVSCNRDTAIIGAAGRNVPSIYTGTTVNPSMNTISAGQVFVFTRTGEVYDYAFHSVLEPTNVKSYDRFGWSVALHEDFIVASSIESYTGPNLANKVIMEVNTTSNYADRNISGYFNLAWEYTNITTGIWRTATTRNIPCDVNAGTLKQILEADLYTGTLIVSRTNVDVYNNGYSWSITFLDQSAALPPLVGISSLLEGVNASVQVRVINPYPSFLRGIAHVFQRTANNPKFVEQAFISPMFQQPADRCGWQVALNGDTAVVGCPNRDSIVPNNNAGAGITYSLSLLHINFQQSSVSVKEGLPAVVSVERTSSVVANIDVLFYLTTIDRNADSLTQTFLKNLFGLTDSSIPFPLTVCDVVGVSGKAIGRAQYYGSSHNESLWVDGMYDYRAISDYVPINTPHAFLTSQVSLNQTIVTNSDTILEKPDELFVVSINSPGIWPSMVGSLQILITIVDNNDGVASGFEYDKLYETNGEVGSELGGSIAINNYMKVMFSSCPGGDHVSVSSSGDERRIPGAGYVLQFALASSGKWIQTNKIFSPRMCMGCRFGDDVKLSIVGNQLVSILAVGEPIANNVHIFTSIGNHFGTTWTFETNLTVPEAYLPNHMFGAADSIGMYYNVIAVGATGLESVYLFRRLYSNYTSSWYWTKGQLLRSSEFDYDLMDGGVQLHRQFFGKSVAISKRTIVVGSPFADYGKLGTRLVEVDWNTEGSDIFGYGRGKAYVFSSQGAIQEISLYGDATLTGGTFRLTFTYGGITDTTVAIKHSADNVTVAKAINGLYYLDDVIVSTSVILISGTARQKTTWSITFVTQWENPPSLIPIWYGYGCSNCTAFSSPYTPNNALQMTSTYISGMTNIVEAVKLEASDKSSGNRFGWTVALDGNQLLVGSIYSPGLTATTWDFEGGQLSGWSKTGTAFDFQPTFGDNSYLRTVYPSIKRYGLLPEPQKSGLMGKYYIGTFEMRPGNASDWRVPSSKFPQGSAQGDSPVGTLTSDVFIILGNTISFLIGGGCNYYKTYVELLVDGFSVAKQVGDCSETMVLKSFDTSFYLHRAAQIRIVDNSKSNWGHINVDEFQFSWHVDGRRLLLANNKLISGGVVETPKSGAVYGYLRHIINSNDLCFSNTSACEWTEEIKLTPSDKRPNMLFGSSIAVNDPLGIAVVGAPGAECTGIYKEIMSVYPYFDTNGNSNPAGLKFPLDSQLFMASMESKPLFAPESSGANGVWEARNTSNVNPNILAALSCGAAYVFVKIPYVIGPHGEVLYKQRWPNTETARIQASDLFAGDTFGSRIAISDMMMAVASTGQDGQLLNAGAIYTYSLGFSSLYFDTKEFFVLQGTDNYATITVKRNLFIYSGLMEIEYATSDLTAYGVDQYKYLACLSLSPAERGPARCGDYEQTTGRIKFNPGDNSGGFTVNILNYRCVRPYLKFFQVTLSVPGSNGITGETMTAKVRIDDNNFLYQNCLTLY